MLNFLFEKIKNGLGSNNTEISSSNSDFEPEDFKLRCECIMRFVELDMGEPLLIAKKMAVKLIEQIKFHQKIHYLAKDKMINEVLAIISKIDQALLENKKKLRNQSRSVSN